MHNFNIILDLIVSIKENVMKGKFSILLQQLKELRQLIEDEQEKSRATNTR